jgi:hypothetical protein
MLKSGGKT